MKPQRFNSECPKCGEGVYTFAKVRYCWPHQTEKCPTWRTFGGEHLHRRCTCGFIYPVLPKDYSDSLLEEDVTSWLEERVQEATNKILGEGEGDDVSYLILPEDIDWESEDDWNGRY